VADALVHLDHLGVDVGGREATAGVRELRLDLGPFLVDLLSNLGSML
jgi:hypothetical protein